jgi:hypothetical protein
LTITFLSQPLQLFDICFIALNKAGVRIGSKREARGRR